MPDDPSLPSGHEFHHLGYATLSIDKELRFFESVGYRIEGERFVDPVQGISGCFMAGAGPRIELLEDLPGSGTLDPWITSGIKLYHFAYLVNDIVGVVDWAKTQRARIVVSPVPAVAFGGRLVSFAMFRNGQLLEFIEKPPQRAEK